MSKKLTGLRRPSRRRLLLGILQPGNLFVQLCTISLVVTDVIPLALRNLPLSSSVFDPGGARSADHV